MIFGEKNELTFFCKSTRFCFKYSSKHLHGDEFLCIFVIRANINHRVRDRFRTKIESPCVYKEVLESP